MTAFKGIWTKSFWRAVSGEYLATLIFVLLGLGSTINWAAGQEKPPPADLVLISLCFGLSIATMVQCFGHISGGHINPAVTAAMVVTRKLSLAKAVFYVVAQCLGAVTGAGILYFVTPAAVRGSFGVTTVMWTSLTLRALRVAFKQMQWQEKEEQNTYTYELGGVFFVCFFRYIKAQYLELFSFTFTFQCSQVLKAFETLFKRLQRCFVLVWFRTNGPIQTFFYLKPPRKKSLLPGQQLSCYLANSSYLAKTKVEPTLTTESLWSLTFAYFNVISHLQIDPQKVRDWVTFLKMTSCYINLVRVLCSTLSQLHKLADPNAESWQTFKTVSFFVERERNMKWH